MNKLFLSLASFLIALSAVIVTTVKGQITNDSGLTLSPPTLEISGNPGELIKQSIRLENRNNYDIRVVLDKRNFTAVGEEGAVGLTEEETTFSLASWLTTETGEFTIPAKASRTFPISINVPLGAEPGGHFGSLIFRTIPNEKLEGSGASLAQEIGSLILLRVAGDLKEDGSLESFAPVKNFFEFGPIGFEARVKNSGNVHLKPRGTITITNMLGQQVATVEITGKNVLPGAVRKLEATWDTKWRLGRYTATALVIYGKDLTQRASVTTFTVFPYRIALAVLLILLILGRILYKGRKRWISAFRILFTGKA